LKQSKRIWSFYIVYIVLTDSNDTSNTAQLLIVIWGKTKSFEVVKELVLEVCISQQHGKSCFQACVWNHEGTPAALDKTIWGGWQTAVRAPSMIGKETGLMSQIRQGVDKWNPKFYTELHCFIHQLSLHVKTLNFEHVMKLEALAVDFIQFHGLDYHQLQSLFVRNWCYIWGHLVTYRSLMAESWNSVEIFLSF